MSEMTGMMINRSTKGQVATSDTQIYKYTWHVSVSYHPQLLLMHICVSIFFSLLVYDEDSLKRNFTYKKEN